MDKAGSLMHMVNDKNPGRLILVMAGAERISLDKESLALFQFRGTGWQNLEKLPCT